MVSSAFTTDDTLRIVLVVVAAFGLAPMLMVGFTVPTMGR